MGTELRSARARRVSKTTRGHWEGCLLVLEEEKDNSFL